MRFEDIEKIYCLSLRRRKDRRIRVSENLKKHDIDFEFFDAVDGDFLDIERKPGWMMRTTNGCLGIIQSYIEIFQEAKSLGLSNFLIFEDDVELTDTFRKDVEVFLTNVPDDWDTIYFGGNHLVHFPEPVNEHVSKCVHTRTTHAVIFRDSCYDKILNRLVYFDRPLDETFATMQLFEEMVSYVPVPPLAWQYDSHSDIEEMMVKYRFLETYTEEDYEDQRST